MTLSALGEPGSRPLEEWRTHVTAVLDGLDDPGSADEDTGVTGPATEVPAVSWAHSDDEYLGMIEACQAHIVRGDAYQLCLTTEARVDVHPDPVRTYLALRASSPSHHGGLIRVGDVSLLSATPEVFLTVTPDGSCDPSRSRARDHEGRTRSWTPSCGRTRREREGTRGKPDDRRSHAQRPEQVCRPGSVSVPSLLRVETYAHVHQLVSTIVGQLATGTAGWMPWPPLSRRIDDRCAKAGATQILESLEQRPRGVYSGVFGYFGLDGRIELAMVIRSIVLDAEGASIGTGGGITALSVPAEELV